jgi:hypothetical protein
METVSQSPLEILDSARTELARANHRAASIDMCYHTRRPEAKTLETALDQLDVAIGMLRKSDPRSN